MITVYTVEQKLSPTVAAPRVHSVLPAPHRASPVTSRPSSVVTLSSTLDAIASVAVHRRNEFQQVHPNTSVWPFVPPQAASRAFVRVPSTSLVASSDLPTTVEDRTKLQDLNCAPRVEVVVPWAQIFVLALAEHGSDPDVDPSSSVMLFARPFLEPVPAPLVLPAGFVMMSSASGTSTVQTHPSTPDPINTTAARAYASLLSNVKVGSGAASCDAPPPSSGQPPCVSATPPTVGAGPI